VKDQAACGSCWTFSATGSLEGRWQIKTGERLMLSEQQLVDCAWGYEGSQACGGSFSSGAFQWIMDNKGMALETTYRYLGQGGWCNQHIRDSSVRVQSYVKVTASNELDLQDAVVDGPVSIAIDASHNDFRFYKSGVYTHRSLLSPAGAARPRCARGGLQ
jgi:cathepsin L